MSEPPSPTSPTDTSEKVEFGGTHLLIGFVIGAALQFGWWILIDRLQAGVAGNTGFLAQILAALDRSSTVSFLFGGIGGAISNPAGAPIRSVIWKSIRWAVGFSLVLFGLDVMRFVLQTSLGESLGDIVASTLWFGLAGAFVGLVMELKRTVSPNIESAPLSFRQLARWALALDRAAVLRVLSVALLCAMFGGLFEASLQGLIAWPLLIVPLVVIAIVVLRLWPPSRKTMRQWLSGALVAIVIFDLLALLALNAMLGVLVGIAVLVGYAILQSRK
jgi:hypothetical protein